MSPKNVSASEPVAFELLIPDDASIHLVMEWRNDPDTRSMSFHSEVKAWESFSAEFRDRYCSSPDLPPLFVLYQGKRVAFIGFERLPHPYRRCCEVSINVAPDYRGKGIGTSALKAIQPWLTRQGYDDLYADVKKENEASLYAFRKAGFELLDITHRSFEGIREPFEVAGFRVRLTPDLPPKPLFLIAEAGSNWVGGSLQEGKSRARALIDAAADAGVDAVKFQVFRSQTLYAKGAGDSGYLAQAGIKKEMKELFDELAMPYEMIPELAGWCEERGVEFMATPFSEADFAAVDPYVKRHKIASYEIRHTRLLELAARSGKPLYLSTGAATEEEIAWAVAHFKANGGKELTLLQCTACYPAEPSTLHLRTIPWLRSRFKTYSGLSDHSRDPYAAPAAAAALGASVIEKHITLDRALPGPDHAFAITPAELKQLVSIVSNIEEMLGCDVKIVDPSEEELRHFACRGLQAIAPVNKGDLLREGENVAILRPGRQRQGIHPRHLEKIEGKKAARAIPEGDGIQWGDWE